MPAALAQGHSPTSSLLALLAPPTRYNNNTPSRSSLFALLQRQRYKGLSALAPSPASTPLLPRIKITHSRRSHTPTRIVSIFSASTPCTLLLSYFLTYTYKLSANKSLDDIHRAKKQRSLERNGRFSTLALERM